MSTSTLLNFIRRDDVSYTVTFVDEDGNAINLTGATVYFTIKRGLNDADSAALISKNITSHSDPTAGVTIVALSHTDTDISPGTYYWDLQMKDSGGNIASTQRGKVTIDQDVTIRTD